MNMSVIWVLQVNLGTMFEHKSQWAFTILVFNVAIVHSSVSVSSIQVMWLVPSNILLICSFSLTAVVAPL